MGEATGTLDVVAGGETKTFKWNGDAEDRAAARAAFNNLVGSGSYFAVVHDGPRQGHQVRTFEEVENIEKERGTVAVQISHALVGG